ncbi:hypothetical protein U1Q18_037892, partial [Sarracenia purpurea var. burkii]
GKSLVNCFEQKMNVAQAVSARYEVARRVREEKSHAEALLPRSWAQVAVSNGSAGLFSGNGKLNQR